MANNTIEKALQRQREAAARQAAQQAESAQEDKKSSTIERTLEKQQAAKTDLPVETPVTEGQVKTKPTPAKSKPGAAVNADNEALRLTIDLEELDERGFVSVSNARKLINEEYREIKRKLLRNAFGALSKTLNNSNIIMVSSARPSEGKTFTAINLALSFAAEQDKTVLLVDADVLKPNVTRTLRVNPGEGLMEYLLDENKDISDVLYRTNVDKLRIIPAGQTHHLSTELLASERMNETIDEFSNRYPDRIVIIDTPPLIGINESAVLASFAGQAVIVTEEGRTKLNDINNIVDRLNPDMAVGFVVNKAVNESADNGNYYGYYYGSGPSE
ncbi:MAG: XrtA-associated tyrosine autokinase [Pseudomonadota bacterium]|uniref:Exopolysaccharide biosynthesis protein n=1 Tax=Alteromonas alba TaxID=2079529 RepID=A0A2S9VDA8_9ALTE|nr:XrtA-associated tyrosine autokinase [Alteromonas alba]MAJ71296.1 exopolysaccharide biosynthesis protein [Alteromonadaceae bacterium]MCP4862802.1 polysaccharide biosynthesis tyrosine autokinase [Alteromonas sp.]MDY6928765.1 XrtA-associated tyrosine autokinase [Pseudomonadota bacterium]RPH20721.1 MAG: polysaccharide biosynthesis tyrosine autokinase [Alteromonadaceae bacterium TMED7]PRO74448.1 exopolysaccharide biosynthesis protein [Alteromonas alba]|tara:strand:+ start:9865 stop:10854 length:990 start_codon:yes stop_codon:yes gene_type:complete